LKPLTSTEIRGAWATLLLKIEDDESIDYEFLKEEIAHFAEVGLSGVYSNGTAGEFYAQTNSEFEMVNRILAEEAEKHHLPFQIGVSHPFPQELIQRIRIAKDFAPGAFQMILPDWVPVNRDEMYRFVEGCCRESGDIGLVIYNPPHAKKVLKPEEWDDLTREFHQIVGIKVGGGDLDWYERMAPVLNRISVFIPGHFMASGIQKGAHGAYSNVACLSPKVTRLWLDQIELDREAANELESRIITFMRTYIHPMIFEQNYSNQAVDKFMATVGGWSRISPRLRWPYLGISESKIEEVRTAATKLIPELFR